MLTLKDSSCFLIEAISEIQSICITSFDFPEDGFGLPIINYIYFSQLNSKFQTFVTLASYFVSLECL